MKKKVLVLGSRGMLGHMVYNYLLSLDKYSLIDASYPEKLHENSVVLDVTKTEELNKYLQDNKPDIIVNCIGILLKGSSSNPSNAIYLNSFLPHQLSKISNSFEGKVIHVSTDCVFSGKKGKYSEEDYRDADDTYGRSKALGELNNDSDLTLRTSIIGPELNKIGEGLFHWFMNQSGEINGFSKMMWSGVTTLELAKAVDKAITEKLTGLVHVTNNKPISKYEMVKLFKEIWAKDDIIINRIEGKDSDKSLISIRKGVDLKVPSYRKMFQDQYDWMVANRHLYDNNYSI